MSRKIIAIGGGDNGRIRSNGEKTPYETVEIDQEIVKITGKDKPNFLFLAHSQIEHEGKFGPESEKSYYEITKYNFGDKLGCETKWLSVEDLKTDFNKAKEYVDWADIIYEGGGNTYDMLLLWKETGFDKLLETAWESGKVMCGISAGAMCWFAYGNTDDPRFADKEVNKLDCLGFIDAYLSPHCQEEGKRQSEINSIKALNEVCISLSNCTALEIVDDEFRIIKSTPDDPAFRPYALKSYWKDGELIEEELVNTNEFEALDGLLKR